MGGLEVLGTGPQMGALWIAEQTPQVAMATTFTNPLVGSEGP